MKYHRIRAILGFQKRWRLALIRSSFAAILALAFSLAAYHVLQISFLNGWSPRPSPVKWVDMNGDGDSAGLNPSSEIPHFRIALAPTMPAGKTLERYQSFMGYISGKLGRRPVGVYRPTYAETNDLVRYQRCEIAFVPAYAFIRGEREFGMKALAAPELIGDTYQSYIIVPRLSPARTLIDLRGRRFASADLISTTGWLFPATVLVNSGQDPNSFFGDHVITGSHDRSIQALTEGFVDGAAVLGTAYDEMAAEDSSVLQKTKVLQKSSSLGAPLIAISPRMDANLKNAVLGLLLSMHQDPNGKTILKQLHIKRFAIPSKIPFEEQRHSVEKLEAWRSWHKH